MIRGFLSIRASLFRDASGLIYLHARYYDPQLRQCISPATRSPQESADGQDRRIAAALP